MIQNDSYMFFLDSMSNKLDKVCESASNDVPMFFLGFGTNARPTMFFIGHEIASTLDIGNDVSSSGLEGFGAGDNSSFDVYGAFKFQCFGAFGVQVEVIDDGSLHF